MENDANVIEIDDLADAAYVRISGRPVAETRDIGGGVVVDFDDQGTMVGVEVLALRKHVGKGDPRSFLNGLVTGLQLRTMTPAAQ